MKLAATPISLSAMLQTGSVQKDFAKSPVWHVCEDGPLLIARVEAMPADTFEGPLRVMPWPFELRNHPRTTERLVRIVAAHCKHIEFCDVPRKWDIVFLAGTEVPRFLLTMPTSPEDVHDANCYSVLHTASPQLWIPLFGDGEGHPFERYHGPVRLIDQFANSQQADAAVQAAVAWLIALQ